MQKMQKERKKKRIPYRIHTRCQDWIELIYFYIFFVTFFLHLFEIIKEKQQVIKIYYWYLDCVTDWIVNGWLVTVSAYISKVTLPTLLTQHIWQQWKSILTQLLRFSLYFLSVCWAHNDCMLVNLSVHLVWQTESYSPPSDLISLDCMRMYI